MRLVAFLERDGSRRFLAATAASDVGATLMLSTGRAVAAIGGYSDDDPVTGTKGFAALVRGGEVRYFLARSFRAGAGRSVANDVVRSRRLVVPAAWSATAMGPPVGQGNDSRPLVVDVYDCSVLAAG